MNLNCKSGVWDKVQSALANIPSIIGLPSYFTNGFVCSSNDSAVMTVYWLASKEWSVIRYRQINGAYVDFNWDGSFKSGSNDCWGASIQKRHEMKMTF